MFDTLSGKLSGVLRFLKGEAKLTEANMAQALKEIRLSLLEADVHFKVVKRFTETVREKLLGAEVQESLNPYQHVVKIVLTELTEILGREGRDPERAPVKPTVIMMVGLQGAGKTTTAAKLGAYLKGQGQSVMLCSLDLKRLAAGQQLQTLAQDSGLAFFEHDGSDLLSIGKSLLARAREYGYDAVIADTAGRLHVDEELMAELAEVKRVLAPTEVLYVADSLTGQDAVQSAQAFATAIGIDGVVLTKLDADSRGGAALSIVSVTGKPILFVGVGEKTADLQKFHPDRLASQILGMGDVLTLIEKAEQQFDEEQTQEMSRRMLRDELDLDDFAAQLRQVRKMGSLSEIMAMMPGMAQGQLAGAGAIDDRKVTHTLAIIDSMTRKERQNPKVIDGRRRLRISRGSGRPVQEINQLLKSFLEMKKTMKKPFFRKMLKRFDISRKMM